MPTRIASGPSPAPRPSATLGAGSGAERRHYAGGVMIGLIVLLLIVWLVLAVLGFVIKGLFWLAIIGIVLFLATGAYGAVKRSVARR